MSKPDLFIVTSAIVTNVGSLDKNSRFLQTLSTINSIKVYNPNSVIVLVDSSLRALDSFMQSELKKACIFFDLSNDPHVLEIRNDADMYSVKCSEIYHIPNKTDKQTIENYRGGYIKNATEMYMLLKALTEINSTDFNRIFKLSGRYTLISDFNRSLHTGNVTTRISSKTNQPIALVKVEKIVNCILWSFDSGYAEEIKKQLTNIAEWLKESYSAGLPGPDIEHGIYRFINDRTEITTVGVLGAVNDPTSGVIYTKI